MTNNDFGERVTGQQKRLVLRHRLFFYRKGIGGLNVGPSPAERVNKVDLPCHLNGSALCILFTAVNDTNVHSTIPDDKVVEENVLHNVGHFLLAEPDSRIAKSDVFAIILVWVVEVAFAPDILAFALGKKEGIGEVVHVRLHRIQRDTVFAAPLLFRVDGIGHACGIGQ